MATGIVLELSDDDGNNRCDCSIRVTRHDVYICKMADAQILEMILVNFNQFISKMAQIILIIIMKKMMCFI